MEKIRSSSQSLLGIINDVLDFSKIEAGKLPMESIPFDIGDVMENLADLFRLRTEDKNLELLFDIESGIPKPLIGDPLRLGQVLTNLTSNAVRELESAVDDRPYDMTLMDWQMPGIDGVKASKLIKQHPSLAKIRTIVMVSGHGKETVMNEAANRQIDGFLIKPVGPSVLFDTLLKVINPDSASFPGTGNEKPKPTRVIDAIQGADVLIVEENKINQQVASEILSSFGVKASLVENGAQAIDAVLKNPYDLVLMDIQMPEMDGLEATLKIRNSLKLVDLPIIAMTAHAMSGDREKSLAAGMNDHITKPVDPNELAATLTKWIKPRSDLTKRQSRRADSFSKVSSVEDAELPADLPDGDLNIGIRRLSGNKRLLKKLLLEFYENYHATAKTLRDSLAQGDLKSIQDIAHTVKGVAGSFGATKLQDAAAGLENVGDDRDNSQLLQQFERYFNPLIQSLESFSKNQQKHATDNQTISPLNEHTFSVEAEIKPNLIELHGKLLQGNADSSACLDRLKQQLVQANWRGPLSQLDEQIEAFDYDDAILTLTGIAQNLGIDIAGE